MTKLVPDNFTVPEELNLSGFRLCKLTAVHTDLDYEAVMSSKEHLRQIFAVNDTWPSDEMTLEEDRQDLEWHDDEFQRRTSFTYTVLSPDASKCLGAVYIFASQVSDYDADIYLWVRADELENDLDTKLFAMVKTWIQEFWPFQNPAYPGRDILWKDWPGKSITQTATHR